MTRSTLAWASSGMDSISSSSSVPPLANSNLPIRLSPLAPVKAPASWPNSSDSISSAGMAAQLTATKGPLAARGEVVQAARDDFLAGAGLALEDHICAGMGASSRTDVAQLRP
jgi:hypothetical protein